MTIDSVIAAINHRPRDAKFLVSRNINVDLDGPKGNDQEEYIVESITVVGI